MGEPVTIFRYPLIKYFLKELLRQETIAKERKTGKTFPNRKIAI